MAPNRQMVRNGSKPPEDVLVLDLNDIRVREMEELEELTGVPFPEFASAFTDGGQPLGKTLRVLGYILKRRDNPDFTMEMAGELKIVFDDTPNPTKAARRKP